MWEQNEHCFSGVKTDTRGEHTERGGAAMTMTDPAGAVSTKCAESLGADLSVPRTICTV